jgi:uncharacterized protein YoxC
MADPVFWLGLSILLVAVSLAAVLVAAMPAFRELARAARSAEKLFDTLSRELPPTLKSIRDTGAEISSLTDDMSEGVQGAGRLVSQVDQSVSGVKKQAKVTTRGVVAGVKAAWAAFNRAESPVPRLAASSRPEVEMEEETAEEIEEEIAEEIAEELDENLTERSHSDAESEIPIQASLPAVVQINPSAGVERSHL